MENTNQKNFPTSGVGYSSYPQPGFCHPGPPETNYLQSPPPPYQQLQPQFAAGISNQPMGVTPVVVVFEPPISMAGAIVLSCFVFWCFGWLFGLIAFILAMIGQNAAAAGDIRGAIQLRNASYGLSIAGIIIGIIVIGVIIGLSSERKSY